MLFRKSPPVPAPLPQRDTFELKAWPPTVRGEGRGLFVAILGLIVIVILMGFGLQTIAKNGINLTVRIIQAEPAPLEKPPPN